MTVIYGGHKFCCGKELEACRTTGYTVLPEYLLCDIGFCVMTQAIGILWKQHDAWMGIFIDWPVCAFG